MILPKTAYGFNLVLFSLGSPCWKEGLDLIT